MTILIIIICLVGAAIVLTGVLLSAPRYKGPVSDHFNGSRFFNPDNIKAKGFADVLKWMTSRHRGEWNARADAPPGPPPLASMNQCRVTFVNHTTFLIQVQNLNILTDPVWSRRVSPFSWLGPARMRPPGIRFEDLPPIHFVILSHNHYDHLDRATVTRLSKMHAPTFVVPLGVGEFLRRDGISSVVEMDWAQELNLHESFHIRCVPAIHFSGRGAIDRDATLWCGYIMKSNSYSIYFAGDTGYHPTIFKEIGNTAAIDLALIPIGAYKPRWFMSPIHASPDEAVMIHIDVKARQSIASHYGTFALADEGQSEPAEDLRTALQQHSLYAEEIMLLEEGIPFDLK